MNIFKYLKKPSLFLVFIANKGLLNWMPDEMYLKLIFKAKMGYKLNLKNPQTFNEKIQWLKLNDRKTEYTRMVDKYEAKKLVGNKIGNEYIIKNIGIWNSFDEIDFSKLPDKFVLKCTHDSGGLVICRNKELLDKEKVKNKLEKSLMKNYYKMGREWPYKNVKPRIIAEEYMEDKKQKTLRDYKFYCFSGCPKYLYISEGLEDHSTAKISFYDLEFNDAPFKRNDYKTFDVRPEKPKNYEKMIELSRVLSNGFSFLRVDFYEINDKIYFGELTFSPCSGFMPFNPKEYDKVLGSYIDLKNIT